MLDDKTFTLNEFNPTDISKKIAKNQKLRRLEMNITQEELSQKSGVSLGSIKRFENTYQISLKNLLNIAVVLNSTQEFINLFTQQQYSSIKELNKISKAKTRKRARSKL